MKTDNTIAGYVAFRHGAAVGYGPTSAAAYRHAAKLGLTRCEVLPANPRMMELARRAIEDRTWSSELELLRQLMECAIEGIDADWPFSPDDDDERDARYDAISEELAEAERMEEVSTTQVPAPEHLQRRAITAFPGWLPYAGVRTGGGRAHAE